LDETRTALRRRPESGLLAGLWEFPNVDGTLSEEEVHQLLLASGLVTASLIKLRNAKHIFTHIEWEMTGYLAVVEQRSPDPGISAKEVPDIQWVGLDLLEEKLTLPAAFKTYYQIVKRYLHKES
jgi:A/G-specific adenine glycosylase